MLDYIFIIDTTTLSHKNIIHFFLYRVLLHLNWKESAADPIILRLILMEVCMLPRAL